MPKAPLFSIIINNFNYAQYLKSSIESVLSQRCRREIIVVDDGSSDLSRSVIDSFGRDITPIFKANGGQASCFNAGFDRSKGDVILFLDADDCLMPDSLSVLLTHLEEDVAQVHWSLAEIDASGNFTGSLKPERLLAQGDLMAPLVHSGPRSISSSPTSGNAWSRASLSSMLPMPEAEFRLCADAYLHVLGPTYGRVARSLTPLSCWRRHGENLFNERKDPLNESLADDLNRYGLLVPVLERRLRELGIQVDPDLWLMRNASVKRMQRILGSIEVMQRAIDGEGAVVLIDDGDWSDGFWRSLDLTESLEAMRLFGDGQVPPGSTTEDIVKELLRLRDAGATHVACVWPGTWLLDLLPELGAQLDSLLHPVHRAGSSRVYAFDHDPAVAKSAPSTGAAAAPPSLREEVQDLWSEIDGIRRDLFALESPAGSDSPPSVGNQ
jgi:glycosyltransferase involved in cell wall biosynthesis